MSRSEVYTCQCGHCQQETSHPDQDLHRQMNLLLSRLDEQQRRWYVAVESNRIGAGGDRQLSQITGLDEKTIQRGRQELASSLAERPTERVRVLGAGRLRAEKKMRSEIRPCRGWWSPKRRGTPTVGQKWVRSSLRQLSRRLGDLGHRVSPPTVGRLLRHLGYSLRVNVKKLEASASHPERAKQFDHIEVQKQRFQSANWPIISVDTKKKELIGNFKNAGQAWGQQPDYVNVHDFPQEALGKAVPYGIYDLTYNRGTVYVGSSADTPEFAVTALARWWEEEGKTTYPEAKWLLILADSGGSNGCRPRMWKQQLQEQLSDRYGLTVVVWNSPTGCSKWNPIEHRLFSYISLNWAGCPLRSFETLLYYLRGTTTSTGLTVRATLLEGAYARGQKVSVTEMEHLNIEHAEVCAQWNYTLHPRVAALS